MREKDSDLVSDLIDVADVGASGVDRLNEAALVGSLRRLIRETRSGSSEFSGFQNYIPSAAAPSPRTGDE